MKFWCEQTLNRLILRIILPDLFANLHERDKAYFRESREARFGATLEQYALPPEEGVSLLRNALFAHARNRSAPVLSGRRGADFRRLHRVRFLPMGAYSIAGGSVGAERSGF